MFGFSEDRTESTSHRWFLSLDIYKKLVPLGEGNDRELGHRDFTLYTFLAILSFRNVIF